MPFFLGLFGSSNRRSPDMVNYGNLQRLNGSLRGSSISVSERQLSILSTADKSIRDTWRTLDYGSGNQFHDVIYTHAESLKRVTAMRDDRDRSLRADAYRAARFRAGNCLEMAAVNGLLLANAGLNRPVSVAVATNMDHCIPIIGDPREREPIIFSDAWPLFGRSDLEENYELSSRHEIGIVETWAPDRANPAVRRDLLNPRNLVSQREVDSLYRERMKDRDMPISSRRLQNPDEIYARAFRDYIPREGEGHAMMYMQLDSSKNVNTRYRHSRTRRDGSEVRRQLSPQLPRAVYENRKRRLDAATLRAVAHVESKLGTLAGDRYEESSSDESDND